MLTQALMLFANTLLFSLRLSGSGSFPKPLSAAEETLWLERFAQGDPEARNVLIERNLRLVAHIVKKYYTQSIDQEDLISIGTIGLIKGVDSFNNKNGVKFATYASKCIQNEILMHFRSQKKLSNEVSINDTIDVDRDGNPLTYIDVVCSDEDVAEEIDQKIMTEKMLKSIDRLLDTRQRQIIMMRYGIGGSTPLTQREIAQALGISRSYVSRIEKSALSTLKEALE